MWLDKRLSGHSDSGLGKRGEEDEALQVALEEHEVEKEQVGEKRKQAGEQGAGLGEGTLTGEPDSVFCKDCVSPDTWSMDWFV